MSETNHDDLVDSIFENFKSTEKYKDALQRAAEEMYENEMVDTNMAVLEIAEVAEKYEFYSSKEERQHALENCEWATKRDWINDKVQEWLL